ncbi:MAG: methionine adenosyltransferase [Tenericutes bacterium GWC2_34_14]|nr:MAG: methionine adenosyltransferase [Tenericutes bacterium GWC2_34_14]OHE34160.1 MAG: methionine adenosyltransferase [Tenericutes bacterium GWE2_34_108]OHE35491.1 MAG: methionine adenosyltransferase [Tenericutes bacterium GWF1_35_14]OHE38590.1 MAG: methionine adenosyltransferase [Tenericutes bacterium GWF2_35_184]OHE43768.1 MAG: methionine adenosyltransferase [Tenericutes bacterium RIFOXYA2_FULL_36_32]OHE45787.1 MAG: methionine adenosyltransferase [Tenericutes bacterium RIFOXYB2_FULL_36_25]
MKIITSESVFKGHPDKICDQISDAILDAHLEQDRNARVAVETAIKDDVVFIFGEVTSKASVNYKEVVLDTLKEIGYDDPFDVIEKISKQSDDIALGVNHTNDHEQGAGDQGLMFGYACKETPELMPLPIVVAHDIARSIDELRKAKYGHVFGPDGKCQVSVVYENDEPIAYETIVVSAQTKHGIQLDYAKEIILDEVLKPLIGEDLSHIQVLINPTGAFVVGGPYGDSGLTGRKIIVDTYGGYAKHGGGAFSGKDVSKVDRSAAYYARFVAKALVAANLADRCEVSVSYSIGVANPVSVSVDTFGTGVTSDEVLLKLIKENFNFTPSSIIKELNLDKVKFKPLAAYGHIGRVDLDVAWEQVDAKAKQLSESYEKTKRATQVL